MTGTERQDLKIALDFLREWREDDKDWKAATDKRLAKLESRNVAQDAVATAVKAAATEAQLSKRWRVGLFATLSVSIGLSLLGIALRVFGIGA